MTIVSGCYQEASDWTLGQIEKGETIDRHGLVYAINTRHMVLPLKQLTRKFYSAGYGDKAISKWLNLYNDAGILTWKLLSADRQYVSFLECPIDEIDIALLVGALDNYHKKLGISPEASA